MHPKNRFYVYGLFETGSYKPFYIGKGTGQRAFKHKCLSNIGSNYPVHKKIRSLSGVYDTRILVSGLNNEDALELEELAIEDVGRRCEGTGLLLNLTTGGAAPLPSEETKQKISKANIGKHCSKATREKLSIISRNPSDETRAKLSKAAKGRKHSVETKNKLSKIASSRSLEYRVKMSITQTGRKLSTETKDKIRAAWKFRGPPSDESRKKMSEAQLGRKHSDETRAKMSESAKNRYKKP